MADEKRIRVEIGFDGGRVLSVKLAEKEYRDLIEAIKAGEGWQALNTDETEVVVAIGRVNYIRREAGEQRVGF